MYSKCVQSKLILTGKTVENGQWLTVILNFGIRITRIAYNIHTSLTLRPVVQTVMEAVLRADEHKSHVGPACIQ